ncbi:hypothetical protein K469DRAFT_720235 [Zopfia rhizophila CBS 207.26]|uniref:Cell surface protein n=1 Tax=Zopfia rhizophila CBS 207.26 TaxID=1314779 RepID=A0A6A6EMC7_9PEZI|nr:hypothetical protein K469DRAFT_720235 [Zopfia rhizophila CBS 207.26]
MSGSGAHAGNSAGDALRKGVGIVHGAGEAIRGNINAAVDSAAGDRHGAARNQAVADRGFDEMEHGHYHGTGAGVTPTDTARERQNRAAQGEYAHPNDGVGGTNYAPNPNAGVGSTNYGPHHTNLANKVDPRFDSDTDHRGTVTGSTNYGPHETNVGNKLDPRYDSDLGTRR